jgi:formate dehydrogenase subunit beta
MNDALRAAVKKLFEEDKVKSVIGYRQHPLTGEVVPAIVHSADQADQLIFDKRCVYNLSRAVLADMDGPVGVVVKGCDGRSLSMRITENDFAREHVVPIAVACPGVDADGELAERCQRCTIHVSPLADVTVGDTKAVGEPSKTREDFVAELRAMKPAERASFWSDAFESCTHCFACREACPLCNCKVCITDKSAPQWIEQAPKPSSNMMWHLIRAFHHAGRCVDCGECQRACPENIPMHLLDMCLAGDIDEMFGFVCGAEPEGKWPFLLYDPNDPDSWLGGPTRG